MLVLLRRVDRRGWQLTYFDGGMRVPLSWRAAIVARQGWAMIALDKSLAQPFIDGDE